VIVGGGPLLGLFVGVLGGGWVGTHPGPLVVLMPDGFLSLPSSNIKPGAIIRYRNVEQMRFERDKGNLVVTMTPSFLYEINLARFDQSPHLLAQRVQEAYTRFRASGVTQSDSARQKKRPEALDLDMAAFLAEIQEGTATFLRYASAPSEKRPVGEAWANKDADKRWAGIWSKGIVPASWHVVKARRAAVDRFVLMPGGLIDLKSRLYGCSCLLINYKDVEQMHFESDKGKLVVTWSSSPWTYEIDLTGHDVAPHLIASRVQEAYTSCKVGISRA
ncbi:MAG: hypothetical protein J2P36_01835, partial [Ktedonobacteraceae bacterium]|nr:hypothetical protein [Ktedonobacteraceae bacterium]